MIAKANMMTGDGGDCQVARNQPSGFKQQTRLDSRQRPSELYQEYELDSKRS
jgi:hypothetical protein